MQMLMLISDGWSTPRFMSQQHVAVAQQSPHQTDFAMQQNDCCMRYSDVRPAFQGSLCEAYRHKVSPPSGSSQMLGSLNLAIN